MKTPQHASLLFTCLLSLLPIAATAQPFVLSANGLEVTDSATGLIWRRCAEGMTWDGSSCSGTASTFTHEAALARARTEATATGVAWRLPNIRELSSIADTTLSNPAIDTTAFPATPASMFWSASPNVGVPAYAWGVYFVDGSVYDGYGSRINAVYVRLVRVGQ